MAVVIRPAAGDFERGWCEGARIAYYLRRHEDAPPAGVREWWLALDGDRRTGCFAISDYEDRRWVLDFYRVPGRPGARAVRPMVDRLVADAEERGMILAAGVAIDNAPQQRLMARCGFAPVGVLYERRT